MPASCVYTHCSWLRRLVLAVLAVVLHTIARVLATPLADNGLLHIAQAILLAQIGLREAA